MLRTGRCWGRRASAPSVFNRLLRGFGVERNALARIIHDASSRSTHCNQKSNGYPGVASRGAPVAPLLQRVREEPRGREAYRGPVAPQMQRVFSTLTD